MQPTHPFNVFRFCPKCGSSRFNISGERSMKCSDCSFQYFINSVAAVAALVTDGNGRLLLTTRGVEPHYGKLDLPGGFIDPGETAEEAVARELDEELGLKVKAVEYVGSATNEYIYEGFSVFTLDMAYRVTPVSVEGMKAMDDILEYRFYSSGEIDFDQVPAPSIRQFIKKFFRK